MNESLKNEIDTMSYESMLRLWRFAPDGHPMFQGEVGEYYSKVMGEKRNKLADGVAAAISKLIGW